MKLEDSMGKKDKWYSLANFQIQIGANSAFLKAFTFASCPNPHPPHPIARAKVFANAKIGTLVSSIIIWISTIKHDKEYFILPLVVSYILIVPNYLLYYYLSITVLALP